MIGPWAFRISSPMAWISSYGSDSSKNTVIPMVDSAVTTIYRTLVMIE